MHSLGLHLFSGASGACQQADAGVLAGQLRALCAGRSAVGGVVRTPCRAFGPRGLEAVTAQAHAARFPHPRRRHGVSLPACR